MKKVKKTLCVILIAVLAVSYSPFILAVEPDDVSPLSPEEIAQMTDEELAMISQ